LTLTKIGSLNTSSPEPIVDRGVYSFLVIAWTLQILP
jgi:hypothetical protein